MTAIQRLLQQAQLAEASYTLLDKVNYQDAGQVLTALDVANVANFNGSFSTAQATAFVSQWRVVDHIPDTNIGFSATLFERLNGGAGTGEFSLAIRGSTDMADFLQDGATILDSGIAIDQLLDLYNFWQRVTTPTGWTYGAATLAPSSDPQQQVYTHDGIGMTVEIVDSSQLANANLRFGTASPGFNPASIEVSGHSLGGHLAMAFTRLFPDLDAHATAVNGLGFKLGDAKVTKGVRDEFFLNAKPML